MSVCCKSQASVGLRAGRSYFNPALIRPHWRIRARLEMQLLSVERQRLILIAHMDGDRADPGYHRGLLFACA